MKTVRLLKNHNGQKKGTTGEVANGRAEYLVRTGVAEYVESKPKTEAKTAVKKATTKVEPKSEPCKTC